MLRCRTLIFWQHLYFDHFVYGIYARVACVCAWCRHSPDSPVSQSLTLSQFRRCRSRPTVIMTDSGAAKYAEVAQDPENIELKRKSVDDDNVVGLKPKMTLLNGITVIVGSIIGSGIFISPTGVLAHTGSPGMSLVVWVASGIFSMIGAYCYAELGCMIQKTGADYAYIMVTFGPFLAFMRLWVECLIVRPCSQTIVALTFSAYIMKPFFPTCEAPDVSARLLAAVCISEYHIYLGYRVVNRRQEVANIIEH